MENEELQQQGAEIQEPTQEAENPESANNGESHTPQESVKITADLAKKLSIAERKLKKYEEGFTDQKTAEIAETAKRIEDLENRAFYAENSQYKPYEKLINALKKDGQTLEQVVSSEEFKLAYRDEERQPVKSVIHSNSRIADGSSDYQKDFEEAKKTGDWANFLIKHKGYTS